MIASLSSPPSSSFTLGREPSFKDLYLLLASAFALGAWTCLPAPAQQPEGVGTATETSAEVASSGVAQTALGAQPDLDMGGTTGDTPTTDTETSDTMSWVATEDTAIPGC